MTSCGDLVQIVQQAQHGDQTAFGELVSTCADRLAMLIRVQLRPPLRDRIEVDDLVQETLMAAWQALPEFQWQGEDAFWGWLACLGRRMIQNEVRRLRAKRRAGGVLSLEQKADSSGDRRSARALVDMLSGGGASPSKAYRRDERFARLRRALRQLTPDHRMVIFLTRLRGLSVAEVAGRMHRSPNAVSMLLLRALKRLKDIFGTTESFTLPERSLEDDDDATE